MAMGITSLLLLALASFMMFSGHSFAALFNYVDLDDANRVAMDQLSRDIRQAIKVNNFTATTLELDTTEGGVASSMTYAWDSGTRILTRTSSKDNVARLLLHDCDSFHFDVCKRNPKNGTYDIYPAATVGTAKVIDVSWVCSRSIFGRKENTESVQTARIVIRKQGT